MRAPVVAVLLALTASCTVAPPARQDVFRHDPYIARHYDDGWDEYGQFHLLERNFRDPNLADDSQFGLGLELAGAPYGAWLGLEFGLWGTSSDANWVRWTPIFRSFDEEDLDPGESGTRSFEISLGARKEYRPFGGPFVIDAGLGLAMVQLEEATAVGPFDEDSDADVGLYGHWGVFLDLAEPARIGFDVRFVEGTEHQVLGRSVSGDYLQWSLVFSFFY
ncbi:MAG: hypothetical protein R3F34_13435 [Planctomycetota bacterium]